MSLPAGSVIEPNEKLWRSMLIQELERLWNAIDPPNDANPGGGESGGSEASGQFLERLQNLADVANVSTSRTNLGVGTSSDVTFGDINTSTGIVAGREYEFLGSTSYELFIKPNDSASSYARFSERDATGTGVMTYSPDGLITHLSVSSSQFRMGEVSASQSYIFGGNGLTLNGPSGLNYTGGGVDFDTTGSFVIDTPTSNFNLSSSANLSTGNIDITSNGEIDINGDNDILITASDLTRVGNNRTHCDVQLSPTTAGYLELSVGNNSTTFDTTLRLNRDTGIAIDVPTSQGLAYDGGDVQIDATNSDIEILAAALSIGGGTSPYGDPEIILDVKSITGIIGDVDLTVRNDFNLSSSSGSPGDFSTSFGSYSITSEGSSVDFCVDVSGAVDISADADTTISGDDIRLTPSTIGIFGISLGGDTIICTSATGARVGFFGAFGTSKQTITGSKGGNAALASLISALASHNLITDNTT